jgi:hypothetical protein
MDTGSSGLHTWDPNVRVDFRLSNFKMSSSTVNSKNHKLIEKWTKNLSKYFSRKEYKVPMNT